ncbi:MAG: tetratricopeptide (TPR) repeat protein, partial [Myxococcota bacterium]
MGSGQRGVLCLVVTIGCLMAFSPVSMAQTDSRVVGGRGSKATKAKPLTKAQKKVARDMKYASFLLLIEKDYAAAAAQYKTIVKRNKKNVNAHMGLISAYSKQNDQKSVVAALKRLTKVAPRDRAAWAALGDAQRKTGSVDDAVKSYNKALSLDRNYAPALLAMGDRAYQTFVKDRSDANKSTVLDLYGRYLKNTKTSHGRTGARVKRVVTELRDGPAAASFLDGQNLYNKAFSSRFGIGRAFEKSYAKMDVVLKKNPKHAEALYYQGLMHISVKSKKLHNIEKGVAKLKAAGEHAPSLTELGRLARRNDDLELATQYLVQAHTIDPKSQKTAYELGLAHKLAGRRDKAIGAFDTAVDADPRSDIGAKAVVELSILAPKNRRVFAHFRKAGRFKGDIFNTEKFKGSIASLERRLGGVDEMAPEQEWLDEMMRKLIAAGETNPQQVFMVKVVKTTKINAFAVPNGNLYFTRGFLKLAKETFPELPMDVNHHAIASVMGHEITHVVKEHVIRSFVFKDALNSGRMKPSSLVSVTRTHEIEADREGMKMMFLAGYDPTYAVKMFEAYAAKLGEVPAGLDHPTFDERIHYLEEYWSNEMSFAYSSFHS